MMSLWWAALICLLAWSSGAFFGAGIAGRRAPAWSNSARASSGRARREAGEKQQSAAWRLVSLVVLAGVVWLVAKLVVAQVSPTPWLQ